MKTTPDNMRSAIIKEYYEEAMKRAGEWRFMGEPINPYDIREVLALAYYMSTHFTQIGFRSEVKKNE